MDQGSDFCDRATNFSRPNPEDLQKEWRGSLRDDTSNHTYRRVGTLREKIPLSLFTPTLSRVLKEQPKLFIRARMKLDDWECEQMERGLLTRKEKNEMRKEMKEEREVIRSWKTFRKSEVGRFLSKIGLHDYSYTFWGLGILDLEQLSWLSDSQLREVMGRTSIADRRKLQKHLHESLGKTVTQLCRETLNSLDEFNSMKSKYDANPSFEDPESSKENMSLSFDRSSSSCHTQTRDLHLLQSTGSTAHSYFAPPHPSIIRSRESQHRPRSKSRNRSMRRRSESLSPVRISNTSEFTNLDEWISSQLALRTLLR